MADGRTLKGVHFLSRGTARDAVVFVHGCACDHTDWDEQTRQLSVPFRVLALDLPGHGKSGPPAQPSVEALSAALVSLVTELELKSCVVAGHSMGCRVVLDACSKIPERVTGLIFVDGSLAASDGDLSRMQAASNLIESMGNDRFIEFAFKQMFVDSSSSALRERIVARALSVSPALVAGLLLDTIRWDALHAARALAKVSAPVLAIQSSFIDRDLNRRSLSQDMETPWTALVRRLLPSAEMHTLTGQGHFPHIEAASTVNQIIGKFLHRVFLQASSGPRGVERGVP